MLKDRFVCFFRKFYSGINSRRSNLKVEQLPQIDEFCRQLKNVDDSACIAY
jgi:predicted KAP-like P-loop ATPase